VETVGTKMLRGAASVAELRKLNSEVEFKCDGGEHRDICPKVCLNHLEKKSGITVFVIAYGIRFTAIPRRAKKSAVNDIKFHF
jgi:hypothetical protein